MNSNENHKRAVEIVNSWPLWKRMITLTKYSKPHLKPDEIQTVNSNVTDIKENGDNNE